MRGCATAECLGSPSLSTAHEAFCIVTYRVIRTIAWGQHLGIGSQEKHSRPAVDSVSKLLQIVNQVGNTAKAIWTGEAWRYQGLFMDGFQYLMIRPRTNSSIVAVLTSPWLLPQALVQL